MANAVLNPSSIPLFCLPLGFVLGAGETAPTTDAQAAAILAGTTVFTLVGTVSGNDPSTLPVDDGSLDADDDAASTT